MFEPFYYYLPVKYSRESASNIYTVTFFPEISNESRQFIADFIKKLPFFTYILNKVR